MRYYSTTAGEMVLQTGVAAGDTTVVVDTTAGLPVTFPYTLLLDYGTISEEVVDVTAAAGTSLTVTRGRDGTVAQAHPFGAKIRHGVTARDYRESREHEEATEAHGATGAVVGTTNTQTLDNKTFAPSGDHAAATMRTLSGNVEPVVDVRDESDARVAGWYADGLKILSGANAVLTAFQAGAVNLYNSILELRVSGAVNALTGRVSGTPTGKFIRLLSGVTELFSVAANGDLSAQAGAFASNVAVSGTLSGPTVTALQNADTSLGNRVGTLEGQTLDSRVGSIETNLGSQTRFAATSASKDAKRLHWGTAAVGTGDAGGYRTITHGAGFTPTVVTATLEDAFRIGVDSLTSTTFRLRILQTDGSAYPSYTGTLHFVCGE